MKHSGPIIDPGSKLNSHHLTVAEKYGPKLCPNNLLLCCRAFNIEGTIFLWTTNTFVFTQASAVEKFWSLPLRQRLFIEHVTFRIVGRYYDDKPGVSEFYSNGFYHDDFKILKLPVIERCPAIYGSMGGLQSYCWYQIADFITHLCQHKYLASHSKSTGSVLTTSMLFPSLKSMRIDLVSRPLELL